MRRLSRKLPMNNEVGAMLCRAPDGSTVFGPQAEGSHDNVQVPYQCPAGSEPYGVWHTHPHGVATPSDDDLEAAREFGLRRMCVTVPQTGETRCRNL
jgi:proteasome lid subunit RPN8/RPN11